MVNNICWGLTTGIPFLLQDRKEHLWYKVCLEKGCVRAFMCVCAWGCMCICVHVRSCVCMGAYVCAWLCVYMYIFFSF